MQTASIYRKKEFWANENLKYAAPHFRLEKAARLVNKVAHGKRCDLLDVGCGPAALMGLLDPNVRYHGIDIAIQEPSSNLLEVDFVESPIGFLDRRFDIIVAQGVFEYLGGVQRQKLSEIADLLHDGGTFIATYVNFGHRNAHVYWPYNNVLPFSVFRHSLLEFFDINRYFPTSHRWSHDEPRDGLVRMLQKHVNVNIPLISLLFGVEYFFICSKKRTTK